MRALKCQVSKDKFKQSQIRSLYKKLFKINKI